MTDPLIFARAMADETRQQIMRLLCCQSMCVGDVAEQIEMSQPTISHHLAILREAGLVNMRREGKQVFYTLNQEEVADCCGLLMRRFAPGELELSQPVTVSENVEQPPTSARPPRRSSDDWQVWKSKK